MALIDCRGNPVSTSNPASLRRYEEAAELAVSYFVDPLAAIDAALAEDPDFTMGHCLKAGLALLSTENAARPLLAASVEAVERLARAGRANHREYAHGLAARAWLDGDFAGSIARYGDILLEYPRDLLALQIAHVGDFLLGASQMLRDRIAQVMPRWSAAVPGYGYVLGMYAFGLEETGLYARAEDHALRALELNRRDAWAVHAGAHVMEMMGRVPEGIAWLTSRRDDWAPGNGFAYHNWWHLALHHLELGDERGALAIYDQHVRPAPTRIAYENIDATAMLWRLALRGVDVGDRFQAVAADWEAVADAEEGHYAFNDVHAVLALAGAGRADAARRTLAAMERRLEAGGTNAMMTRDVGLPLARAFVAFARGEHDRCVELLMPVRTIAHRFGGSHAQRDLVHLTLVEAAVRAGRGRLATALASERTELKPQSPFNWLLAARAHDVAGEEDLARRARTSADLHRKAHQVRAAGVRPAA